MSNLALYCPHPRHKTVRGPNSRQSIVMVRRVVIALFGMLVMGLPALAGDYYYTRVAPRLDVLAEARQILPPKCEQLERQLHSAFMERHALGTLKTARSDRETGLRMCVNGSEEDGATALKAALHDLGVVPKT